MRNKKANEKYTEEPFVILKSQFNSNALSADALKKSLTVLKIHFGQVASYGTSQKKIKNKSFIKMK